MKLNPISLLCLGIVVSTSSAIAEEMPIDVIYCGLGNSSTVADGMDTGAYHTGFDGIMFDASGDSPLHGAIGQCDVVVHNDPASGDHVETTGLCVAVDGEGDSFAMTHHREAGGPVAYEILHGTGKWEGATGQATAVPIVIAASGVAGSYHLCSSITGTITTQ